MARPKDEKPPETIGEHVRERRKALGLSQAEAAKRIGVVRDALARWEINRTEPDVRVMPGVIAFLGYDPQPAPSTFRELLVATRRALGLSQVEFGNRIGVPMDTLHAWERGLYEPGRMRMDEVVSRLHRGEGRIAAR